MIKTQNSKQYDLEKRTYRFAKNCKEFIRQLPKTISNLEYVKQLVRSSSSPAANYIEANESLSKKDFYHRVRICRKEAKESRLWLKLIDINNHQVLNNPRQKLIQETIELTKIFGAILEKAKIKNV